MAIDTAEKRRAVAGLMLPFLIPGITHNALKDAEWRQQAAWSYSGIEIVAYVEPPSRVVILRSTSAGTRALRASSVTVVLRSTSAPVILNQT